MRAVNSRAACCVSNPGRRRPRNVPSGPINAMVGEWLMLGAVVGIVVEIVAGTVTRAIMAKVHAQ
jgi:hypothetical protein